MRQSKMRGRIREMIPKQLTIYCLLLFALAPADVQLADEEISQSVLKQIEIMRNSKSKEMLKYMNLSVDPCQDFYAYCCGNWGKYHVRREHETLTTASKLEQKVQHDLIVLLEEQQTYIDGFSGNKVKEFYRSCTQALANGQKQQTFHSDVVKKHGGFPAAPASNWALYNANYDWVEIIGQLRYQYGMDILIGIDVDVNPYNKYQNAIYLTEPSTIIPPHLCSAAGTKELERDRQKYDHIEDEVIANLKNWLSLTQSAAVKVANAILTFEFELCTAMRSKDSTSANFTNHYVGRSLYDWTQYFNGSIDFYKFIASSYKLNYAYPVVVRPERYFHHLIHTISLHDKPTLANYIMYRALSMLSFPLQDNKHNRPKFCAQLTKRCFPKVVGFMYYHKFANLPGKTKVEEIYEKLKVMLSDSLKSSWLDQRTSLIGLAKLNDIVLHFPTYEEKPNLNNLPIDVHDYWKNLNQVMPRLQEQERLRVLANENLKPGDEVEAYEVRMKYHNHFKRIDVGWALLQPPYFHENYPDAMHYATLGQLLAVQLASAFDDVGWTSDVLNFTNWDLETALKYSNISECFRSQISYYLNNDPYIFQNRTQLRELSTFSSSVNVAFAAYLNWLLYLRPNSPNDLGILRKETLSDMNFTNTQLFFVTFAQMNCQHEEDNRTIAPCCPLQSHTLARYKVNGPLLNSLEFGKEFSCHIGSQMNAVDKCIIY